MPKGIIIVGLGPGAPGLLTVEAQHVLQAANEIYLRTRQHPTVETLPTSAILHSFDDIYDRAATFEAVYDEIASRIVELGQRAEGVVYAVPGHPLVGEASVQRILALAKQKGLPVHIVEGLSFVEPICTQLVLDPLEGLQIADAITLAVHHYPEFNPDLPLLVGQLYDRNVAADVKLTLMTVYPDDHVVMLVRAAGSDAASVRCVPLYELDRGEELDHLTSLYVPPLSQPGSLAAFQEVVAHLRAPSGCPWDREQTHSSLRPFLLEEMYEVLQALDEEDIPSLKEELGDLLLQILLHTQIAIEDGEFKMADVVSHIVAKLKRRHPHVFGDVKVANANEVLVNWERIKGEEKLSPRPQGSQLEGQAKVACPEPSRANHVQQPEGALAGVPVVMPALARAQSLQQRVARLGFDWPDVSSVLAKVKQEWTELRDAMAGEGSSAYPDEQPGANPAVAAELGDVLFSLVSLARWLSVDAESALREATSRFERRFQEMERECAAQGQQLADLSPDRLNELWELAKKRNG